MNYLPVEIREEILRNADVSDLPSIRGLGRAWYRAPLSCDDTLVSRAALAKPTLSELMESVKRRNKPVFALYDRSNDKNQWNATLMVFDPVRLTLNRIGFIVPYGRYAGLAVRAEMRTNSVTGSQYVGHDIDHEEMTVESIEKGVEYMLSFGKNVRMDPWTIIDISSRRLKNCKSLSIREMVPVVDTRFSEREVYLIGIGVLLDMSTVDDFVNFRGSYYGLSGLIKLAKRVEDEYLNTEIPNN